MPAVKSRVYDCGFAVPVLRFGSYETYCWSGSRGENLPAPLAPYLLIGYHEWSIPLIVMRKGEPEGLRLSEPPHHAGCAGLLADLH